jgi:hypothetical protein
MGYRDSILNNFQIKTIMKSAHTKLKKIFAHYSMLDTSNLNITNQHTSLTMNIKELIVMARQLNCMKPGVLTDATLKTLFSHVQYDETSSNNNTADAKHSGGNRDRANSGEHPINDGDDDEMNFEEFKEILCAMSAHLYPNPWTPAHKKLKLLLENVFAIAKKDIL